jgi:hypothetical protein
MEQSTPPWLCGLATDGTVTEVNPTIDSDGHGVIRHHLYHAGQNAIPRVFLEVKSAGRRFVILICEC